MVIGELSSLSKVEDLVQHELEAYEGFCDEACRRAEQNAVLGVSIFSILYYVLVIVLSSLLIVGVKKTQPRYMIPFISYVGVTIFLMSLSWLMGVIFFSGVPLAAFVYTFIMFVALGVSVHWFLVLVTYLRQVRASLGENPIRLEEDLSGVTSSPPYSPEVKDV